MLLTRSPLIPPASWGSSFDLHVLSTPPAFILSQDQTLRKKQTDATEESAGKREPGCTKKKSRQKTRTMPRGWHTNCGRFTNKKIGVNKLGTLLSSQTTGAPGNHATTLLGRPATLRSNFSNLPDPLPRTKSARREPSGPVSARTPGIPFGFPSGVRREIKQYTPSTPTPNRGFPRAKSR